MEITMLTFLAQLFCDHKFIKRNRDGRYHVECMHCLQQSNGIVETLKKK
jgi:hypothetical protein